MHLPLRLQLTLWYTALLAGALLVFSSIVFLLMSRSLIGNLDVSLHQRVNQLIPTVDVQSGRIRLPAPAEQPDTPFIPATLLTRSGRPIGALPPGAVRAWLKSHGASLPRSFYTASDGGIRFATAPIEDNNRRVGSILVWQSMHSIDQARRSLLLLMVGAGPVLLLLAGMGGMLLARRALRPVAQITQIASSISATDLHRRVPVGPSHDELNELATTFNAMIARLEAAVERERRFTADASHELRSPLAVILAETSLALEQPLAGEEYLHALSVIHEQAGGMQELVSALLTLARIEALPVQPEVVPLSDVVDRAIRQCQPAVQARNVHITGRLGPDLVVEAEETLLTRAMRNILDNAIKASRPGGTVQLRAWREGETIVLAVEDEGPGIAPEHAEKIFEPFYQVNEARTPGDSHGLGLAICRRIVRAHGGEVTVRPATGTGACFEIRLPAVEPPAGAIDERRVPGAIEV